MIDFIAHLPHRAPFLFVTEIISHASGRFEAVWRVNGSEDFFRGHFPSDPVVPGVLITEALAQACGLAMIACDDERFKGGMLAQSEMRFRHPVRPPASITLLACEDGGMGRLRRFAVTASLANVVVAEGTIVLSVGASDETVQ